MAKKKTTKNRSKRILFVLVVLLVLVGVDFGFNGTDGILVQTAKSYITEYFGFDVDNSVISKETATEEPEETLKITPYVIPRETPEPDDTPFFSEQNYVTNYTDSQLDIYFFDVGQADCIGLFLDGEVMIIDAGNAGDAALDFKVKKKINMTYELQRLGVSRINKLIITHAHEDHMGAGYKFLQMFEVDDVYANALLEESERSKNYQRFVDAMIDANVHLTTPTTLSEAEIKAEIEKFNKELMEEYEAQIAEATEEERMKIEKPELLTYNPEDYIRVGDTIPFGNAIVTVLAPNSAEYSDINDTSIVVMVEFEGVKTLFTGDAGKESEEEILNYAREHNFDLDCDVLKVGHHGSRTANTDAFIQAVDPEYAIVMVAEENSYGLPDEDVIERLEKYGATIYQTKDVGDIHLVINDGEYYFASDYSHEVKKDE